MSDQPTTQELILQEVRDLTASQGEMRMGLNASAQKIRALEERVKKLEADCRYVEVEGLKTVPRDIAAVLEEMDRVAEASRRGNETFTGSIDGLPGVFTVTAPGWEGAE